MKKILIGIGIVVVVVIALLIFTFSKIVGIIHQAEGKAIYSSLGAWTRIQEFAQEQGKADYIKEADDSLKFTEREWEVWLEDAEASDTDLSSFEKVRKIAYDTTDENIESGQNPLEYLDEP